MTLDAVMFTLCFFLVKDKMDAIMCATMATNLVELRHYYSHGHHMIRQILVRMWGCYGNDTLNVLSVSIGEEFLD